MLVLKTHVRTMFLIKKFFPGIWKRPKMSTVCQENGIFYVLKWFILIFWVKKAVKELFWTGFPIFPSDLLSTQQFQSKKLFIKWFNNKVKVPCLSLVNQLLRALLTYKPPQKLHIFSTASFQLAKNYYNYSFIDASQ